MSTRERGIMLRQSLANGGSLARDMAVRKIKQGNLQLGRSAGIPFKEAQEHFVTKHLLKVAQKEIETLRENTIDEETRQRLQELEEKNKELLKEVYDADFEKRASMINLLTMKQ